MQWQLNTFTLSSFSRGGRLCRTPPPGFIGLMYLENTLNTKSVLNLYLIYLLIEISIFVYSNELEVSDKYNPLDPGVFI